MKYSINQFQLLPCNRRCRSEEHTSELQSQSNLVCRLLLEKKKKQASFFLLLNAATSPSSPCPLSLLQCYSPLSAQRGRIISVVCTLAPCAYTPLFIVSVVV